MFWFLSFLLLASTQFRLSSETASMRPPHVVLIVVDSVGKGDLFASEDKMGYSTPNLNKLVQVGANFRNYYVQSESSPTRAALITGRYPFKLGLQDQLVSGTTAHIPLNVPTLPEMLRSLNNYESHLIGGWNLGGARREYTPTFRGFQSFYGFLGSHIDYYNKTRDSGYDFWDEIAGKTNYKKADHSANGIYSNYQYRERTIKILEEYISNHKAVVQQNENPLFLYLSYQYAHPPIKGHPDHPDKCKRASVARKQYCAMMIELDAAIGELQEKLEEFGLWENALIIFSSDSGGLVPFNGFDMDGYPINPGSVGSNYPLRGSKTTLFEGGIHGTGFVSGGYLAPEARGKIYEGLAHAVDIPVFILNTVLASSISTKQLSEFQTQFFRELDGHPIILKEIEETMRSRSLRVGIASKRTEIPLNVMSSGIDFTAIRFGRWKLLIGATMKYHVGDGWWPANAEDPPTLPDEKHGIFFRYKLYDMVSDISERHNLANNLTEVVKDGRQRIYKIVHSPDYREPQLNIFHPLSWPALHDGAWAPFLDDE